LYVLLPMAMLPTLWGDPLSAGEDDVVYYYPLRTLVAAELSRGRLAMYNPREATGMPLMADPQSATLHPTSWLFVVLPGKTAYAVSLYLSFSLAGGGAYLYLRRLGLVTPAAVFGSIAFMFCGFLVGHRVHQSVLLAACMLPWGLWVIERLRRGEGVSPARSGEIGLTSSGVQANGTHNAGETPAPRFSNVALLTPIVFWSFVAGHWPTFIHMMLIWGVYFLFRGRPVVRSGAVVLAAVAIAMLAAWPQVAVTTELMHAVTRQKIGLAMAGENSFLPTSAVLAFFPFFQGCRTPNFFPQSWWGSWHLCEMLGYVGLVTLVLAGAVVWRGFRKNKRDPGSGIRDSIGEQIRSSRIPDPVASFTPLIRTWTWMLLGACIFMVGYYLPTYWLIHKIPVLGVMRCPARMVLAADMALATLSAVGVHLLLTGAAAGDERLRRTLRTVAVVVLPAVMVGWLIVWAAIAAIGRWCGFDDGFGVLQFVGGPRQMFAALGFETLDGGGWRFTFNPAVWGQLALTVATAVVVTLLLRATRCENDAGTRRRVDASLLFLLLLVDLFFVTRFVDVPAAWVTSPDPGDSPAAAWLRQHDPDVDSYRIYTLSPIYHYRPDELLHPKTCTMLGFHTIGNYGPFQSPWHVQMFGFRIWGLDRDWADHVRGNHLLSVYGVKYILATDPVHREVLDSVTLWGGMRVRRLDGSDGFSPAWMMPDGENLLTDTWQASDVGERFGGRAEMSGSTDPNHVMTLGLQAPFFWWFAKLSQLVELPYDGVYKLSFEARAPEGGATLFLQAVIENAECNPRHAWFEADEISSPTAAGEQTPWRRFERTMSVTRQPGVEQRLTLATLSERTIEIRNVQLRRSHNREPINFNNALEPGDRVYELVAELPARNPSQPPVAIYENLLAQPIPAADRLVPATDENVDALKFLDEATTTPPTQVPDISLPPVKNPARLFLFTSLPAVMLWMGVIVLARQSRGAGVSPARPAGILPAPDEAGLTSSDVQTNGTHNAGETPAPQGDHDGQHSETA